MTGNKKNTHTTEFKQAGRLQESRGKAMRYQIIEVPREEFVVTLMYRVLDVSASGYYARR